MQVPQKSLSTIYPSNYYSFSGKSRSLIFKLKNTWDHFFFKSLFKNIHAATLSVLDIGGATGEVLDMLKKADNRISYTEIVDINEGAKYIAEKKGHVYHYSTIENYTTQKKFDVILLLNIIEHVESPYLLLKKAEDLLVDGGLIIIKTPNTDSWDARLFRNSYWGGLHCPRHWIIFSDESFKKMLKNANLVIRKTVFTQGAPFWAYSILQLFRKKDIHLKKKPLIEHPLFGILSMFFAIFDIARSPFSKTSQMFIILTKRI